MSNLDERSTKDSLDLPELLTVVDNDRELLAELVGIFNQQMPLLLKSLQEAVAHEDMKTVEVTSHTLKGMLSNLRAPRAALTAGQIEQMGRQQKRAGLRDALATFEAEAQGVTAQLNAILSQPPD
jgi:HPt (histidine-containing phosphotransfer) domain-containing protein